MYFLVSLLGRQYLTPTRCTLHNYSKVLIRSPHLRYIGGPGGDFVKVISQYSTTVLHAERGNKYMNTAPVQCQIDSHYY